MRTLTAANEELDAVADDYWQTALDYLPLFATALGDRRYDALLPDESEAGLGAIRARFASIVERAEGVDASSLDPVRRVTRTTLIEDVHGDLATIDSGLHRWTVDPLEGVVRASLSIPRYQRLETPEDGGSMAARWRGIAGYVDTHVANLRRSLADGIVAPRAPVARVIDSLETLLASPDTDWPLLRPASDPVLDGWSAGDRQAFRAALADAVAQAVRPSFARLREALTNEILPAARSDDRAGVSAVPGGADAYRRLIRRHTSLELTPEELHRTGLSEIERIDGELRELTGRVLGTGSLAEGLARSRTDPALTFTTRDEVQADAERSLARANEAVPDWFGRLPVAPCIVVRMDAHEEAHSTIGYYRHPAADGSRPGQYLINTAFPETRPRYEAEVLAFHEAVPGHHLQIGVAQELDRLPEFRRHLGPTAYVEGWALYTERLCDEMGLYTNDLDRIGMLSYDAWRASRLVVDTGIHALGWSRDRAIAFMTEHTALAPNNIANEVDRYIVWPGQALAYKTGQLELQRLRARARERLGARFDVRAFHDTVLDQGALPLGTLGEVVERWVEGSAQ